MYRSIRALTLVLAMASAGASHLTAEQNDSRQGLYAALLGRTSLVELQDDGLLAILDELARSRQIIPRDGTGFDLSRSGTSIVAVPLQLPEQPESILYLFYLPKPGEYFFLQLASNPEKQGRTELRLWGDGDREILITEDRTEWAQRSSKHTFRPLLTPRFASGQDPRALTPDQIIACIGATLGIGLDFSSVINALSSLTCTYLNSLAHIQTVLHCFSMVSVGVANVTSTAGCLTGVATLISCGVVNCSQPPPQPPPQPSQCSSSISLNTPVSGTWTTGCSSAHRSGRYARYYTFTLSSQTQVRIDLQSGVDTYLFLLQGSGTGGSVIASDDDGGDGSNSRIAQTLAPGTYTVEATTYSTGVTGSFTLSVATTTPPPPPPGQPSACTSSIPFNTSVSGSWTTSCTSAHRSGRYARYYTFSLTSQTQVRVDLQSSVDTYLFLLQGSGSGGSVIASDDDGGDGSNSRITQTLAPGAYTVEATTYSASVTGSFTLSVSTPSTPPVTTDALSGCTSSIPFNTSVSGTWTPSCTSAHRTGRYARYYTFTLNSPTQVRIDLQSSVDTYLFLLQGSGSGGSVIASDDDGGSGTNSRIAGTLAAGTYTIEATTYGSGETGSFVVSIMR